MSRATDSESQGRGAGKRPAPDLGYRVGLQSTAMADEQEVGSVIAAAERAAGDGDYALAERHLREAAALQEARFGPVHPDLANTLNNLGVACEQAGKLDEAEESYRRAYAIALVAFPPDHPFVVRSTENLRDFCAARDRPFDPPAPVAPETPLTDAQSVVPEAPPVDAPPVARPPVAPVEVAVAPASFEYAVRERSAPRPSRWLLPALAIVGVAAIAIWWTAGRSTSPSASANPVPVQQPQTPPTASSADPEPAAGPIEPAAPAPPPVAPAAGGSSLTIARADVCRNFSTSGTEWRCDVVAEATSPGVVVFLTRMRSPQSATVVHRWYRNDALVQRVELRIGPNPGAGYRTYSRNTVNAGDWRVELVDASGAILHQQRFVVR